ncbi:hypothetical protein [Neorhizobium alkalisoli]|uniref:Uncharacterized protein n=1 Tax=Neorhizobium alkalisoli TaxID=528178 RepID=A0A561Q0Y0_9HYPH|nr:hypothetical protein [Neorhizobium alkalisoli]TWF43975.1 hypothetical protein FHW37_11763 [Neorhizobium alkalisoli]
MDAHTTEIDRLKNALEIDEALIHALYLRLRAEIETREAIIDAAAHGAAPEVLEAMATDPVPVIDEFGRKKTVAGLLSAFKRSRTGLRDDILDIGP